MSSKSISFPDEFNLADYFLFDRIKEGLGDKTAIRFGDKSFSYQEIAERTKALTKYYQSVGLGREERVLIVLPDTPAFSWAYFAAFAHGAVVAMGNPASPDEDLSYLLEYTRAGVIVTLPETADALSAELSASPYVKALLLAPNIPTGGDCEEPVKIPESLVRCKFEVQELANAVQAGQGFQEKPMPPVKRDDFAIWLFTSGSTGKPKAAMHTHRDHAFNCEVYAKGTVGFKHDDVTVSVPRLYFGYATGTNLMYPFSVGATACLFSERPTPESLANAIEMYRPTVVTNVPTMMAKFLDYDDKLEREGKPRPDLSCVRFHLSAGEALPPPLLERFTERFGNDVYDGIGSAEMCHIYASNRPGDIKPGSLGRVIDGYELRVLATNAEGPGSEELPAGEVGVLWAKGDSVSLGYFQDRDKSWETYHGHWCRTGDLFRKDEDGYFWFEGRADSMFKVGGIWVSPLEVEQCLLESPTVAMAAVIPAQEDGLEKPKAFIVARDAVKDRLVSDSSKDELRQELQEHVKSKLSKHKYPRWVVFVDEIPRNDRGKINRKVLTEREERGENPWT